MELVLVFVLCVAVAGWSKVFADRRTFERRLAELESLVYVDALTGLGNRRKFDDALRSKAAHAIRAGEPLVVLVMDVNDFKGVNDEYGHGFGDRVLRRIANAITDAVRPTDVVCRFGGDEFAVILQCCDIPGARTVASRMARNLEVNAIVRGEDIVRLSISIGGTCLETCGGQVLIGGKFIGSWNEPGISNSLPESLCHGADNRLYVAKQRKTAETCPVEIS